MYKITLSQGQTTDVVTKNGDTKSIKFDAMTRQHTFVLVGALRNPDGSKRRRKSASSNMPISIITEN